MKKNNRKKTIKKRLRGGTIENRVTKEEIKLELDGLDLTFIYKLISSIAKLMASGVVFGTEKFFSVLSQSNPKPLSKESIHQSILILNAKLGSIEEFLKSPEGQEVLRKLKEKLTILADEMVKVTEGPLKTLIDSNIKLIMEHGEKFAKKGAKFSKNIVRIVPGVGDAFIVAENLGTAATAGTQSINALLESFNNIMSFMNTAGGSIGKIGSTVNDIRKTFTPIITLLTIAPNMAKHQLKQYAGNIPIDELIQGGTKELSNNIDKLTHLAVEGLQRQHGGRRNKKTIKNRRNKL